MHKASAQTIATWNLNSAQFGLSALEAIVEPFATLDAFLNNPAAIEDYFQTAQKYFGANNFHRASFEEILEQTKIVIAILPELKNRLWKTNATEIPIKISPTVKTTSRLVNRRLWDKWLSHWLAKLVAESNEIRSGRTELEQISYIDTAIKDAEEAVENFERNAAFLDRDSKIRQQNAFYDGLRRDKKLISVASYLLYRQITSIPINDVLCSNNADLIIDLFRELRQYPRIFLPATSAKRASGVLSHIKRLLPAPHRLLQDLNVFPREMHSNIKGKLVPINRLAQFAYVFTEVPRQFHGIWKGIALGECIGGTVKHLDSTTPERWATIAIYGAKLIHVEKSDTSGNSVTANAYLGYVHLVPVMDRVNHRTLASMDFGAPVLRSLITVEKLGTENGNVLPLYLAYLKEATRQKGWSYKGILISDSNTLNNARVLDSVRLSNSYILGEHHSPLRFVCTDPLATKLVGLIPRHHYAKKHGGRLIIDAGVKDARTLTELALYFDLSCKPADIQTLLEKNLSHWDPVIRWRSAISVLRSGASVDFEFKAIRILMRGLARTSSLKAYRNVMMQLKLWPHSIQTADLWLESVTLLKRWIIEKSFLSSITATDRELKKKALSELQKLARNGGNRGIREIANVVLAELSEMVPHNL